MLKYEVICCWLELAASGGLPVSEQEVFNELVTFLDGLGGLGFDASSQRIIEWINNLSYESFLNLMRQIGTIPESIAHDSTPEKQFSKATDAALSRAFRELGLKSSVLHERADAADVIAESKYHAYTLVADSKAFRLSRTARNQKDYKVSALSSWRHDADFAVLCAPYFQYPNQSSQIYKQALDDNVALFSWEQILVMLDNHIIEDESCDLSFLWNWSSKHADVTEVSNSKNCFLPDQMREFSSFIGITDDELTRAMNSQIHVITLRGENEIAYWDGIEQKVRDYSREKAISELLSTMNIRGKKETIQQYVNKLSFE
jgi:type II restriction enzyme